ncbi:unnamed protein product [Calypogeia fissa]
MAGLALAVDLLQASATTASKSLHSFSSLSALSAAVSASVGITFLPSYPALSPQFDPWDWAGACAVCDAGEELRDPWAQADSRWLPQLEKGGPVHKAYTVELKPLFSAFRPRNLAATTLRACLVNFLPLLENYIQPEEDDLEDDVDRPAKVPVDAVVPLKRSAMHILREVAVITTRRVLERAVVIYASPRIAWKLLKDVPKSAVRKSARIPSKWRLFWAVQHTAFRGHALGVMANWVVQLVLDIYRYLRASVPKKRLEGKKKGVQEPQEARDPNKDFNKLLRKTAGNSLKGGASLVFASIGAGLGTVLIKPSIGTWIGCAAGDLAGPYIIGMWLDAWIFYGTFSPPSQDP